MKRVNYANALILDESFQHVLLVKNGNVDSFYWSFPGGGVEGSESLKEAAIREVGEETGYIIEIEGLYSLREVLFENRGEHALLFTFIAKIVGGELRIADPDNEILEAKWVEINSANQLMPYIPNHIIEPLGKKLSSAHYYFHGQV